LEFNAARVWREGDTQRPQGVHRALPRAWWQSRLRKYTIGPYGKLTLHHARATAQRVFAERFEGRDPAAEKLEQRRRQVVDRVDDLIEAFA